MQIKNKLKSFLLLLSGFSTISMIACNSAASGEKDNSEEPINPVQGGDDQTPPKNNKPSDKKPETPKKPTNNKPAIDPGKNPTAGINVRPRRPEEKSQNGPALDRNYSLKNYVVETNNPNKSSIEALLKNYEQYENAYIKELSERQDNTPIPNETFTESTINKFNQIAKNNYYAFFNDSYQKNFTIPNKDNKLVINPAKPAIRRWPYGNNIAQVDRGKARYLTNEKYKDILLQSFSIVFNNENPQIEPLVKKVNQFNLEISSQNNKLDKDKEQRAALDFITTARTPFGTAWILDYSTNESDMDNGYPTKWYIGTNLHVALALVKQNAESKYPYTNQPSLAEEASELDKAFTALKTAYDNYYIASDKLVNVKKTNNESSQAYKDAKNQEELAIAEYTKAFKAYKLATENVRGETKTVTLHRFNKNTPINQDLNVTNKDTNVDSFTLQANQVNIVYAGTNFLNTDPKSFLEANSKFKELQEMADFAVLELDFSKQESLNYLTNKNITPDGLGTVEQATALNKGNFAQLVTNNFAKWEESRKFKFASYDLFEKYFDWTKSKLINTNFYALGFPNARTDNQINLDGWTDAQKKGLEYTSSLWINQPQDLSIKSKDGYNLSNSLAFRNFAQYRGVTDLFITSPIIQNHPSKPSFDVGAFKEKNSPYQDSGYLNYGLGYNLNAWQPLSGASGSSIRTGDNELLAINFASGDNLGNSKVSLTQAFRSNGHNYHGAFGTYNLEQYDLIYGGGKNQRTSYREVLKKIYPESGFRTWLFKDGLNNIPEEYQFKNK